MEGKPPEEEHDGEDAGPGGWLPPVPPGAEPSPGVFAPPPYQPPAQQPPPSAPGRPPPAQEQQAPPTGQPPPAGQQPPPPAWQQPPGQHPPAGQPPPPAPSYGAPPTPGYGAPPPPPGSNPPPWQQGGWQRQPAWQAAPAGPGNGTAVTGFVLAISSVALLFFSAGLSSILSLGLGIAGAIVGRNGRNKVDRGETTQHRGLGQAGFIIGIVGAVLSLLATITWVLIFALVDDFSDDEDLFDEDFQTTRAAGTVLAAALRLAL